MTMQPPQEETEKPIEDQDWNFTKAAHEIAILTELATTSMKAASVSYWWMGILEGVAELGQVTGIHDAFGEHGAAGIRGLHVDDAAAAVLDGAAWAYEAALPGEGESFIGRGLKGIGDYLQTEEGARMLFWGMVGAVSRGAGISGMSFTKLLRSTIQGDEEDQRSILEYLERAPEGEIRAIETASQAQAKKVEGMSADPAEMSLDQVIALAGWEAVPWWTFWKRRRMFEDDQAAAERGDSVADAVHTDSDPAG